MRTFINLSGQNFGSLTVLELSTNAGRYKMWVCRCECGRANCKLRVVVRGDSLKSGHTKSCGASDGRDPIKNRRNNKSYRSKHQERLKETEAQRNLKRFDKRRAWNLQRHFDMTVEQWDAVFTAQGRCCAACSATAPGGRGVWATDHCHETGAFRGILCQRCNMTLGWLGDTLSKVEPYAERLVAYLKRTNGCSPQREAS